MIRYFLCSLFSLVLTSSACLLAQNPIVARARTMLAKAEGEGTLIASQILVARMRMIADDAPADEQKQQNLLVTEFIRSQPAEYIGYLGQQMIKFNHFRPARE